MLKVFVERPVLATVVSIVLVILGLVGMKLLPVTRFPEIAPPSVVVSLSYPGADAETVAKSVLLPIEEAINGVEDMTYIRSTASNSGAGTVTVFFKTGTNPDVASVNVQTRISRAISSIPAEVNEAGITTMPRQSGVIMTINLYSDHRDTVYDETFLQAYAQINLMRPLLRVDGVAQVSRLGARDYAMRLWLNPEKLALYNLVPQDVMKAISDQNFEMAPGKFGETSEEVFETVIRHKGRFSQPEQFENMVIKTNNDGSVLYLKDLARIEFGATNLNSDNKVDGNPGLTLNLTQTSGSNAHDIDVAVREVLEEQARSFPNGIKYEITYSVREQIDESISQVQHTLFEAFILVFIIVFIFLQDLRSTLIPAIAIPVSLVGTFFFLQMFGFSLNVLTMFALVLAIGIVVDDAIVVVEAIHQKMHSTGLKPKAATIRTMSEITGAILSITMVMAAVFLPVGFMEGPAGIFYRQFAYTLATAILISALNALTLSPALCALLLKAPKHEDAEGEHPVVKKKKFALYRDRFFTAFNTAFDRFTEKYIGAVKFLITHKTVAWVGLALITVIGLVLMSRSPQSFIPTEDDGFITYNLAMPPGASLARTTEVLRKADSILRKREDVLGMTTVSGFNALDASASPAFAAGYINMHPHAKRLGIKKIEAFMDTIRKDLAQIHEAQFTVFARPTVQGFGDFAGTELVLQDRMGGDIRDFNMIADTFINQLNTLPEIDNAYTTFKSNFPQYEVNIDVVKAKSLGVDVRDLMSTIRSYYARVQAGDFSRFGRQYRVYIQSDFDYRKDPESFNSIFVRNKAGEMVPINTLLTLEKEVGPETITRYNLYNAIAVNATPAPGYSSGDVMEAIEELADAQLPGNYGFEWTGMSFEESQSGGQMVLIFALSILFVYFLLSAQYESYILPFAVLLSIPVGLVGVYATIGLVGLQNNIYVQVGLIMLIGLLAKNAILIIEFAVQERDKGLTIVDAAIMGARLRLRPILMTSLAFVAGLVPLMWSVGPSAIGNHSISFSAAGGMLSGVAFGIFVIPMLFIVFKTLDEMVRDKFKEEED
ncbi:efflux RND transporter permease subunit [Sphingobacterium corticibacter]|uniref:Hydrophobe/amphiphile efflux-1 family RND transporter n=1 Tax=Sphingobacterium corticibacter TaxID=2171749 RepID=A0A2T8HGD2_9SPHI|nr:efflux RND transporter permease subunit [Sphingobacterium corticibacter]PVH24464.1 hydrophobe/amphiphile efflux-1 family RND transporter [Sphingobacterium corticibacter]